VNGDGQSGAAGELLAAPIVVEVTDADGAPVEGAKVEFALTSSGTGAEIQPATATTDANGRAEAHLLLGDKLGLQTGEARVVVESAPAPRISFTAVATAGTPDNRSPRADFDWHCDDLSCRFTDASTDEDGRVTGRSWRFGDGGSSEQTDPAHGYGAAGTYTVTLTVTDDDGATDASSTQVTVTAPAPEPDPNEPPKADFEVHCQDLTCTFADRSTDADGNLVNWVWDFGDGSGASERNSGHSYGAAGRYAVTLTVRDNDGAEDTKSREAEPKAPAPNKAPDADFEVHCSGLTCTFIDTSKDDDGTIVAWQWSFGDGAGSTERNPVHVYAGSGHYDVFVMVTDNGGAADTKTRRADPRD
jgi:PKD repeat protein